MSLRLRLAETAGLYDLLDGLTVPLPNSTAKGAYVTGAMLAGADSIDDMDLLRHGGMTKVFGGVRAPSTLGSFLRSFTHGHVQQLDKVNAGLLAGLTAGVPGLLAGADAERMAMIDVDDTVREVHGYAKQGAAFGYTKQHGLNIQLAVVSTPLAAPVIARARLRRLNTASAKGAGQVLAWAITTARAEGVRGPILARPAGRAAREPGVYRSGRPRRPSRYAGPGSLQGHTRTPALVMPEVAVPFRLRRGGSSCGRGHDASR